MTNHKPNTCYQCAYGTCLISCCHLVFFLGKNNNVNSVISLYDKFFTIKLQFTRHNAGTDPYWFPQF